ERARADDHLGRRVDADDPGSGPDLGELGRERPGAATEVHRQGRVRGLDARQQFKERTAALVGVSEVDRRVPHGAPLRKNRTYVLYTMRCLVGAELGSARPGWRFGISATWLAAGAPLCGLLRRRARSARRRSAR